MRTSITHFPEETQQELKIILDMIRHYVKDANMVILYGSYARNDYVLWDERIEFGVHTSYQSDYDILVVISNLNTKVTEEILRHKLTDNYHAYMSRRRHATPRFLVENIKQLTQNLDRCHYFFSDIVQEGILLYDDQEFKLDMPTRLDYAEIKKIAEAGFNRYYPSAISMTEAVTDHFIPKGNYMDAAFLLHQICEKYYYVILLVWTNYRPKNHKLHELGAMVKGFARELPAVFPQDTELARSSFELLCGAYIDARYNGEFSITLEQLEYLLARIEFLREVTNKICMEKIASYERKLNQMKDDNYYRFPEEGTSKAAEE